MDRDGKHKSLWNRVERTLFFRFIRKSGWYRKLIDTDRKKAVGICWKATFCQPFPWSNPLTLNEKITWLSTKTDTSQWSRLSDKFDVREYVTGKNKALEQGGSGTVLNLPHCYGVWDRFEEIDFSKLPDRFVLKCTHDCGSTVLVTDKSAMNYEAVKDFIARHLATPMGYDTCEPHYTLIRPRVMAEELLTEDPSHGSESLSESLIDYKFWCLDGKAEYVFVAYDRHLDSEKECGLAGRGNTQSGAVFDLYEVSTWTPVRQYLSEAYQSGHFRYIPRPENLDGMVEAAECLAEGFPQVRVDLYNIGGKTYFGEMTFTSNGGRMEYFTDEFQRILGSKVDISSLMKKANG